MLEGQPIIGRQGGGGGGFGKILVIARRLHGEGGVDLQEGFQLPGAVSAQEGGQPVGLPLKDGAGQGHAGRGSGAHVLGRGQKRDHSAASFTIRPPPSSLSPS